MLDEQAAEQRADHGRHGERGRDVALVAAALARRDEIADARHRERHEAAGGHALNGANDDQDVDVLRQAAQRGGCDEPGEGDLEQGLAAVAVAELAPQRRGRGGCDDIRRDDPGEIVTEPRSAAIVGSAVARIVWSSTAGSIARTMTANGTRTEDVDCFISSLPLGEGIWDTAGSPNS